MLKMVRLRKILLALMLLFIAFSAVNAETSEQLRVYLSERVDQTVTFDPLVTPGGGTWYDSVENQTYYNLTGYINVTNENGDVPISDIYLSFDFTDNITLPVLFSGRNGTWRSNDPTTGNLILHIPEIRAGESSIWQYSINDSNIRPPLNMTTNYSDYKILAGDNITVTDQLHNVFDNESFQVDTCIYNITITQRSLGINFSNTYYNFTFINGSILGNDATNATISNPDNETLTWDALRGSCLTYDQVINISYNVSSPFNIPTSQPYEMINATLAYSMNQTVSRLRLIDVFAVSEANVSLEKQIIAPADPILYGSNVTWNVSGHFTTSTNISYLLSEATLWVSQRNVNGSFTDPNTIDNDTINTTVNLTVTYSPSAIVNTSQPWTSSQWLFNYSDIPTPIAWIDVNFSIDNDGIQLVNRSVTKNNEDYYIKSLYLIIGYWLEVEKNITNVAADTYHIRIDVRNKGNQVTPAGTIVTIYDFMEESFTNSTMTYSSSPWYNTTVTNNTVSGAYNGTLFQWAIIPNNTLNTSFDQGPARNQNTTWSVDFNVTGSGDYTLLDVFITGLDPQKVDGAGSSAAVVVTEFMQKLKSTEGIFAVVAAILLLAGLVL